MNNVEKKRPPFGWEAFLTIIISDQHIHMFGGQSIETAYPVIKETIPASHLGYKTNNRYDGFPPLMSDGRSIFAGARSETLLQNTILKNMNSSLDEKSSINNAQYREYMVKNARKIMEADFRNASNDVGYYERFADQLSAGLPKGAGISTSGNAGAFPEQIRAQNDTQSVSGAPYLYADTADNTRPLGYSDSDLKAVYLTREELDARRSTAAFRPV
jgi:hypothetical protein